MILTNKHMHAQTSFYGQRVDFYLADYQDGKRHMAEVAFADASAAGSLVEPSFSLPLDCAQELFEELWSQGFRSKHDTAGAPALDAARLEHIADLRKAAKL